MTKETKSYTKKNWSAKELRNLARKAPTLSISKAAEFYGVTTQSIMNVASKFEDAGMTLNFKKERQPLSVLVSEVVKSLKK